MRETVQDAVGVEVGVGDRIAVAARSGSSSVAFETGRVTGFGTRGALYLEPRKTVIVKWEGRPDWARDETFIYADLKRFVKVEG